MALGEKLSFVESWFTGHGQNAYDSQVDDQTKIRKAGIDIFNAALPGVKSGIDFANSLEPARQNAISDSLMLLSPGQQEASTKKAIGTVDSNLQNAASMINNSYKSMGLSEGAAAGAVADANNQATMQKNQIMTKMQDPSFRLQVQQALAKMISEGQQVPGMNLLGSASGLVYGQQPIQVGNGLGEIIGEMAGGWAQGGFKTGGEKK